MLASYKELIVWQKAVDFTVHVYKITKTFPKEELFGLVSQLRRSSSAIPANIAEGYGRGHKSEYIQFLSIAFGSATETETHLIIANKVGYLKEGDFKILMEKLDEIMKMIGSLMRKLKNKI